MYYTVNIKKNGDEFIAEIYRFSSFTLTESIFEGYVGLDCAINYNEAYPLLYKIITNENKEVALNQAISQIQDGVEPLSFWACAFENGHYSKELTLKINNNKAALLLPKPLR